MLEKENNPILREASRLYRLNWGVHWIKKNSKAPVKAKWSGPVRDDWDTLTKEYHEGYGLGVRLGAPSHLEEGYLANLDIDVKSSEPRHRKEALDFVERLFPGLVAKAPTIGTSYGLRLCVRTVWPTASKKLTQSGEVCVVYMPSAEVNAQQRAYMTEGIITEAQLLKGYRVRPAWEVEFMSVGRQVVLPPSIHPETKKPYTWVKPLEKGQDLPFITLNGVPIESNLKSVASAKPSEKETFRPVAVDLVTSSLSDRYVDIILKGTDVIDRSASCLGASIAMLRAGFTDDEILSILTDRSTFLGETAYEHRKTESRTAAADWARKYCLVKAKEMASGARAFEDVSEEVPRLSTPDEIKAQKTELTDRGDWTNEIQRTAKGAPLKTLHNLYLIFKNMLGEKAFRFNQFTKTDEVCGFTPWGSEIGKDFRERDIHKVNLWLSQNFRLEAPESLAWAAIILIADENAYHPVKEYLLALPAHDGVARVDFFLERYLKGEAPQKYMEAVSRKTLVAMVARIFQPGIKFDTMLILEGPQGLRKSTAVSALTGSAWFSDTNLNIKNKDSISDMAGKWVIEQGEMNTMRQHDVAELKQFLSRSTDRMRPAYGRKSQDYPREVVFIGTTNEDIYLKDISGSRRFWPIRVTKECDIEAIERDRDQIFAEALAMYRAGETVWVSDEDTIHLAKKQQEERETSDELTTVIQDWIESKSKGENKDPDFDPNTLSMLSLWEIGGPLCNSSFLSLKMDHAGQLRVGRCLRILGYERKSVRSQGSVLKRWVKKEVAG